MSKRFLIYAAALLGLVGCARESFVEDSPTQGKPLSFRLAVDNLTKVAAADLYTGDGTDGELGIGVVASTYDDGELLSESVFGTTSQEPLVNSSGSTWEFANPYYFPLGKTVTMDVLALADKNTTASNGATGDLASFQFGTDPTGNYSDWKPYFVTPATDRGYADKVKFSVDTYNTQLDVMYAAANNLSKEKNTGILRFKHAQAAIIFNIKVDDTYGVPDNLKVNNLLFMDFAKNKYNYLDINIKETRSASSPSPATTGYGYLKTKGDFTVDNSRNALNAYWDNLAVDDSHLGLLNDNSQAISALNSGISGFIEPGANTFMWSTDNITNSFQQFGDALLVPQQFTCNPWLYYSIGDFNYLYEINIPRGTWKMGHAYIYNITLKFTQAKFTVEVEKWVVMQPFDYLAY